MLPVLVEVEPPDLARVLNFAERPRLGDWTLRSALVRYAQPEPARVGRVLALVRRIELALEPHAKLLASDGPALWAAVGDDATSTAHAVIVETLRAASEIDVLGDRLAAWAADPRSERPDTEVDAMVAAVAECLDELGIPHEERPRAPARGRRGA